MKQEVDKNKFVQYLTEGIDIHIPPDEVEDFYYYIERFINEADNHFEAYFLKDEEKVLISDRYFDYIKFKYSNNKIIFEHANLGDEHYYTDHDFVLNMGLAFVGVLIFIEQFAPSEDASCIFPEHYDKWRL